MPGNTVDGTTARRRIKLSYLDRQFAEVEPYLADIRALVSRGDFTLGEAVRTFEERFAALCGVPHAIGVNSGTDALFLTLRALEIGPGDEVVTSPNTFVATVGAIVQAGARPVFADINASYTIDPDQMEAAITPRTRAVLPVHWAGCPADLAAISDIAQRRGAALVEDAAQAVLASVDGRHVGGWGEAAGFSLHPLKNLNVWGDGGVIVTRSRALDARLRLLRNHGLQGRDEVAVFGYNSRLDSLQALVASRLLGEVEAITARRIENAARLDAGLAPLVGRITLPPRRPNVRQVFHLYIVLAQDRDALLAHLRERGVDAKVHYPVPLHLQPAARVLGYRAGDFPVYEAYCRSALTLPVHQHLSAQELDDIIGLVRDFYGA